MAEYSRDNVMMIPTSDKQELAVYTDGPLNGEPIVLIHGHGADHRMWKPQLQAYPEKGYRVIAPDMRGHGDSPDVERFEIADWVEDLRFLLDHINIEKFHLVGVSMGGIIAGEFACRYPQRLQSLVISDSFGKLKTCKERLIGFSIIHGLRFMRFLSRKKLQSYYAKAYDFPGGGKAAEYFAGVVKELNFDQLIKTRKAINRVDIEERLTEISIPALVMVGTRPGDFFVGLSHRLGQALGTETVLIEGAMDPSNLTATEEFDRLLHAFIFKNRKEEAAG